HQYGERLWKSCLSPPGGTACLSITETGRWLSPLLAACRAAVTAALVFADGAGVACASARPAASNAGFASSVRGSAPGASPDGAAAVVASAVRAGAVVPVAPVAGRVACCAWPQAAAVRASPPIASLLSVVRRRQARIFASP